MGKKSGWHKVDMGHVYYSLIIYKILTCYFVSTALLSIKTNSTTMVVDIWERHPERIYVFLINAAGWIMCMSGGLCVCRVDYVYVLEYSQEKNKSNTCNITGNI